MTLMGFVCVLTERGQTETHGWPPRFERCSIPATVDSRNAWAQLLSCILMPAAVLAHELHLLDPNSGTPQPP